MVNFLSKHRGNAIASPALLGRITEDFRTKVKEFAEVHKIPIIQFNRGERKDEIAKTYRQNFTQAEGVVFIGVAQEKAQAFKAKKTPGEKRIHFDWDRQSVAVNHYYFYLQDLEFGPCFIKICSYAPYGIRICANGHEWVKQQLIKEGITFESLDNGFLSCENPTRLQEICDQLAPEQLQALMDRWLARLPFPLTAEDFQAGYYPKISIWQMEVSLTQVFEKPLQGRQFFENVIRENLDLGRPDQVQLIFDRAIRKNTPSQFRTRVVQHGVLPSLHIEYKHSQLKQYFKENRALRTETTINDPKDFGVNKGLHNFDYLQKIGRNINRRLLDAQQVSSPVGLSQKSLDQVIHPTVTTDGQRVPGLKFGDPRTRALFLALILFIHLFNGFTNATLRSKVAAFLPANFTYKANQMTYDLRRLRLKGIIVRLPKSNRYILTPYGRKVAIFFSKVDGLLLGCGSAAIGSSEKLSVPKTLAKAFHQLDFEIGRLIDDFGLRTVA